MAITSLQQSINPLIQQSNCLVIVGIGNILRGDDAAGVEVIRLLKERKKTNALLIDAGTVPENYLSKISETNPDVIILIDAADMGQPPGTVMELSPEDLGCFSFSTHSSSLSLVIDYLKQETKADIRLIGIQPGKRDVGAEMTIQVRQAINQLLPEFEKKF